MNTDSTRIRTIGINATALVIVLSVILRSSPRFAEVRNEWVVVWLPLIYLAFFISEKFVSQRFRYYTHLYFVVQSLLILYLILFPPPFDYFAIMFVPLSIQAVWSLSQRPAIIWIGIFCGLSLVGLVTANGIEGIAFSLAYFTVIIFVAVFGIVTLNAERARNESQKLLAELQVAHRKLQDYAQQAEELAAIQQRNMLARELHDSVTQTIFSMTLTAQAARMLLERDPQRVSGQLEHLQELAQNALGEMRSLIQQMRPRPMGEEGLVAALRRHIKEREKNDGLSIDLQVSGDQCLPLSCEEGLFRIIQEALNNIVKHAGTNQATITLNLFEPPYSVSIEDQGKGFEQDGLEVSSEHIGLTSMAERARSIGGVLSIESKPGSGTRIRVENIRIEESSNG